MSEERFNRLEDKVDRVDEKVNEVKLNVSELKSDMRTHMTVVEQHVSSDNRIIENIKPLLPILPELADMVEDHKFIKESRQRKIDKLKYISLRVGIVGGSLGIIIGLTKLFS